MSRVVEYGNFAVKLIRRDSGVRQYEAVRGDGRWWTAHHDVIRNHWWIMNEKLTPVDAFGSLGCRIIRACEAAFEVIEP